MTGLHSFSLVLLAAISALMLSACGGAAPGGMAPKAADQEAAPEPATPEEALSQIDRASRDLELALGGPAFASPPGEPPPSASPPPPPPVATDEVRPEAPAPAARPDATMTGGASAPMSSDPCNNACRALSSMERATTHLCGLAGESDARCEGARARVKNAGARVRAQCPTCKIGN